MIRVYQDVFPVKSSLVALLSYSGSVRAVANGEIGKRLLCCKNVD